MTYLVKCMVNRKIQNAHPNRYKGIDFKSTTETRIFKALIAAGINPDYEAHTFVLSPRMRPTVPFYNRTKEKGFHFISEPISPITYTPDFTFTLNGIFVIIEVKGFENDVFPVKRNLFRKYLETVDYPVMYFEVRNKRELMQSLDVVKMESPVLNSIRKLIPKLPEKDIAIANKYLESRDFESLQELVDSAIIKIKRDKKRENPKYAHIDLASLDRLSVLTSDYISRL